MTKRRVVVTGMGAVTPLGNNVEDSWQNILAGKSGVTSLNFEDSDVFSTRIIAAVKDLDTSHCIEPKDLKKIDPFTQFGLVASYEALKDAKLEMTGRLAERAGVAVGSGIGGIGTIVANSDRLNKGGPRRVSPFFIPSSIINMVAGQISIYNNLKGPNISVVTACATGTHSIGLAARMIAYGDADIMVSGGAEMVSHPLCIAGFSAVKSLSKRNDAPEKASRPWDKDRDGFVMGEGAGILVLEEYEHACKRGAKIYAELTGFGMSGDAWHITAPDEDADGASRGMLEALRDAKLAPQDIDYINAHGTSTYLNDMNETKAVKRVFGEHAYQLLISSTKSMTGHPLGAAGAIEAIFSILSIRDGIAPPTINLDNPDEGCDLDYVPHTAREKDIRHVLSNSLGFGGTNGSLIFSKVE